MRIKRLALVGTFTLLIVCFGLYHILDKTLSEEKLKIKKPSTYTSQFLHDIRESKNYTGVSNNYVSSIKFFPDDYESKKCFSPVPEPTVDIQMGHVYDKLKFDNIDGGVWKQGWNIKYNVNQWSSNHKLKVFVVPHSHNDPGWKKTFEHYYINQSRSILNLMVSQLLEDSRRKFIWAEISFFSLWWSEASQDTKDKVKLLLSRGQLEIVTGGWVMADEANSYYSSVLEQLTHGHQWLLKHLNYIPKHSWSIDPFGVSPTFPFLLKKSGFESLVIQRTHYSVKKYLAKNKQLEFRWKQFWDEEGDTELLTHMMPFYSYDVPHTCGPDPKICCQFDFKRLPGYGVSCPWKYQPRVITDQNVAARAELILDQYRKKAQLYSTNVLLVPLGDDFRYDHITEWQAQYSNYQKLFDFINRNKEMNAELKFGTLADYFIELEKEKPFKDFPTLSGDFFTYADRDDHYWSGYYTSRPFHKRMDRVLISYLRSAELLLWEIMRKNSYAEFPMKTLEYLRDELYTARSHHSLFQHHDGITGTAKDHVVQDYANKMIEAIKKCQNVIQLVTYYLLSNGKNPDFNTKYFILDDHEKVYYGRLKEQTVLTFPSGIQGRLVTFYNPLAFSRNEVVTLRVENRLVQVKDVNGEVVAHQISPICDLMQDRMLKCYQLSFTVSVPPLSLVTYSVEPFDDDSEAHVNIRLLNPSLAFKYDDWENKEVVTGKDFSLENNYISAAFTKDGFLKAVTLKQENNVITIPVHLSFVRYSTRLGPSRSGAYLFLPDGEAETVKVPTARVTIVEGRLISQVIVDMSKLVHVVTLYNTQGIDSKIIEIHNFVNIEGINVNYELAMRISTNINNQNVFYTDLNGIQIIKRKRLSQLPLHGNYYPMPSSAYIEDDNIRMTILSAQPLGFASLSEGQIEVMQDRRLLQDDDRGLDQPVMDNKPTLALFRLNLETRRADCKTEENKVWGSLSDVSHSSLMSLLNPLHALAWTQNDSPLAGEDGIIKRPKYDPVLPMPSHIHLVSAHILHNRSAGVVVQSSTFDYCFSTSQEKSDAMDLNLGTLFNIKKGDKLYESTLTFNKILKELSSHNVPICENDIKAFYIPSSFLST